MEHVLEGIQKELMRLPRCDPNPKAMVWEEYGCCDTEMAEYFKRVFGHLAKGKRETRLVSAKWVDAKPDEAGLIYVRDPSYFTLPDWDVCWSLACPHDTRKHEDGRPFYVGFGCVLTSPMLFPSQPDLLLKGELGCVLAMVRRRLNVFENDEPGEEEGPNELAPPVRYRPPSPAPIGIGLCLA